MKLGVVMRSAAGAPGILSAIKLAEDAGIDAAWMSGGSGPEMMTTFAAAVTKTSRIRLGTAVVQSPLRHPVALAQEARTIAQLAPGRFRLGVGSSHGPLMEPLGIELNAPLTALREYVTILRALLSTGKVDFRGTAHKATYAFPDALQIPVMVSALRPASFRLAGEAADGAITWFCPPAYLVDVALPAMSQAAAAARRETPVLVAHVLVCLTGDLGRVKAIARSPLMSAPLRLPFYQRMFRDAGYPEAEGGEWSDAMIEGAIVYGRDEQVAERLRDILAYGSVELMITPLIGDTDYEAGFVNALQRLAAISGR
jgi:alkanesulfonate monooxygenase SsuD/methylene tetrahydromethanopterin reductase-like flavin-dependent oxidoreductase (luciferase family)